jgi:H+/gluconate symporter-like permease
MVIILEASAVAAISIFVGTVIATSFIGKKYDAPKEKPEVIDDTPKQEEKKKPDRSCCW